jgi:Do/DeqQ family serine protease
MRRLKLAALSLLAVAAACQASNAPVAAEQPPIEVAQAPVTRVVPESRAQVQASLAPIVSRASPAVVNVYAARVRRALVADPAFGPFGMFFGVPREQVQRSLGSGVIVRSDGVIVTNNHVVEGADQLKIVLADRREFDARVLLADPRTDLAVLRIDPKSERLPALAFADTKSAQVGDYVIAIGNPFGLQQTVTSGIISALARSEVGINDFSFFIQTDAAINRGNSGGALVDLSGNLLGVNSAIYSESGGSNGIGFAIPAEMVRRVVESAVSGGVLVRPWLGVRAQTVTQELARSLGLARPEGVVVADLFAGGPGERAGLRRGDVIVSVGGVAVNDEAAMRFQAATQRPGQSYPLIVQRGGQRLTVNVRAEGPPRTPAPEPRDLNGAHPLNGARVAALSPAAAEEAGLDPFLTGVIVQALAPRGLAARAGFQPNDVIREVNGQAVRTAADLERALAAGGPWRIAIERGGQRLEDTFR